VVGEATGKLQKPRQTFCGTGYCYEELDDRQPDEMQEWHDFDPDC